jgi:hypothetical protein
MRIVAEQPTVASASRTAFRESRTPNLEIQIEKPGVQLSGCKQDSQKEA